MDDVSDFAVNQHVSQIKMNAIEAENLDQTPNYESIEHSKRNAKIKSISVRRSLGPRSANKSKGQLKQNAQASGEKTLT